MPTSGLHNQMYVCIHKHMPRHTHNCGIHHKHMPRHTYNCGIHQEYDEDTWGAGPTWEGNLCASQSHAAQSMQDRQNRGCDIQLPGRDQGDQGTLRLEAWLKAASSLVQLDCCRVTIGHLGNEL